MDRIMSPEEIEESDIFKTQFLSEYVGQSDLKGNLKVFIEAAKTRNESLDHLLFYGPPGLGKLPWRILLHMRWVQYQGDRWSKY